MSVLSRYRKLIVALVGAAATIALSLGLDEGQVEQWQSIAIAVLTALGVYAVPNDTPKGEPADPNVSERGASDIAVIVIGVIAVVVVLVLVGRL